MAIETEIVYIEVVVGSINYILISNVFYLQSPIAVLLSLQFIIILII